MRHTPAKRSADPLDMVDRLAGYFRQAPPRNRAEKWDGRELATLYLPDGVYKYKRAFKSEWTIAGGNNRWVRREVRGRTLAADQPPGQGPGGPPGQSATAADGGPVRDRQGHAPGDQGPDPPEGARLDEEGGEVMAQRVKPTRSMPPSERPKEVPPAGPLYRRLQARAAKHHMTGYLRHCTWCGSATQSLAGGAVVCPECDLGREQT